MQKLVATAILLAAVVSAPAAAQSHYVDAGTLNCRAQPTPDAAIMARLSGGTPVTARYTMGDWTLVEANGGFCWVNRQFLSSSPPPATKFAPTPRSASRATSRPLLTVRPTITVPLSAKQRSPQKQKSERRQARQPVKPAKASRYGGACPCSGPNICVGPRGGRYCITSGGNKRYGV